MADFWELLAARQLPSETVSLPLPDGGTVPVVLQALLPAEWEALCAAYPADGDDVEPGTVDARAMRSALLAASVDAPEGAPPKDPQWWDGLAKRGGVNAGELDVLSDVCWDLNRRAPDRPDLGKG